ncbi:MAG: hypothetical protein WCS73_04150 [Lentisphaeria bacterium]
MISDEGSPETLAYDDLYIDNVYFFSGQFNRALTLESANDIQPEKSDSLIGAGWNYYCETHGVPCGEK